MSESKLRFFWNGIKGTDGRLQKVSYSKGALIHYPNPDIITIYAQGYRPFSSEVERELTVTNASDPITDYFAADIIRVMPDHPLYARVAEAHAKQEAHYAKRFEKRQDLYGKVA
ncbi:MAG: hypothetical protein ABFD89_11295 [Bryobacteraceae bacterium]